MTQYPVPGLLGDLGSTSVQQQSVPGLLGDLTLDSSPSINCSVDATLDSFTQNITVGVVVVATLNATLGDFTCEAVLQDGSQIHLALDATLDDFTASIHVSVPSDYVLDVTLDDFTLTSNVSTPTVYSVNATLDDFGPYLRLVITRDPTVALDPLHDPIWVAVEFDIYNDTTPITIRLGNRGTIKRTVMGVLQQYEPRLSDLPILLGTSINVTSYGSPVRAQPNGGLIKFAIDESIWPWFEYRWIGQVFRVYTGQSVDPIQTDVDDDLTLVYQGRVASIKHDTLVATIETTDESFEWDNPIVTDFYDNTFPVALQGKPKPQLWGYAVNIEPVIEDEATQTYAISHRAGGLDFVGQVRVGDIPWTYNGVGPLEQGQWYATPTGIKLGSPPLGFDVRCDAQQGVFTVAGLITRIVEDAGGTVDADYMGRLDVAMPMQIGYATGTSPVNRLDAIDDFVTNSGCWWGVGPLGKAIAGVIDVPAALGTFLLDETNVKSLALNTVHPPAWRIRVGYQRNVVPTSNSAPWVLQTNQAKWSTSSQVLEPHYENTTIQDIEPRAVDVPLLDGPFAFRDGALPVQSRLTTAWGTVRSLFDAEVQIDTEDIVLYDTLALDYMMVQANFRITSAIKAIGSNSGSSTLQLWGTIGTLTSAPPPFGTLPPPSDLPQEIIDMGIWSRSSSSGNFVIGVDCPATVTRLQCEGVGAGGGGGGTIESAGVFWGGGGGGSGGYFRDILIVTAGQSIAWGVGAGGAGMSPGVAGTASTGGTTYFGSYTATGGLGGQVLPPNSADGGAGGSASGATVSISGGTGGGGYQEPLSTYNLDVFTATGASSIFGAGKHASTATELVSAAPGSGGGGHAGLNTAASTPGENGLLIITWFVDG